MKKLTILKTLILPIIMLILTLVLTFITLIPNINKISLQYNDLSFYKNTKFDYIVSMPSKDQVNKISNKAFIEKIVPYYYFIYDINVNTSPIKNSDIYIFDDFNNLEYTPFCSSRIIKSSSNIATNNVFIDYKFATKNNLSIGDKIIIPINNNNLEFYISRIYEENIKSLKGCCVLELNNNIKQYLTSWKSLKYSYAYITSKNDIQCLEYLKSYQPLGNKKEREDFLNDLDYEEYLTTFNQVDYFSKIYKKQNEMNNNISQKDNSNNIIISTIFIMSLIILTLNILNLISLFKTQNSIFREIEHGKNIKTYILIFSFSNLILFLPSIISIYFYINSFTKNTTYIHLTIKNLGLLILIAIGFITTLLNIVIDTFYFTNLNKKYNKK